MAGDAIEIKIDADTREAIKNLAALQKSLKDATEETDKLGKQQKELAEKSAKVSELWQKGFSDELPEKAKNAAAAFKLFGDSQLTSGQRAQSLFAGLSIGKSVVAGYAGAITGAVSSLVQMSAAAREAEVRLERHREIVGALGPAMQSVAQATGGAASQSDAWAARTALLNAGLSANAQQIATVVEGARRHREAGESNADSIERVIAAIRGEENAQQRIGIVTRTSADAHDRYAEVLQRLSEEQRRHGIAAETSAEQQARQASNVQRAQDAVLAGANELFNPLHQLLVAGGTVVDVFDRGQAAMRRWRDGTGPASQGANALTTSTGALNERMRVATSAQNESAQAIENLKAKTDAARAAQEAFNAQLDAGVQRIKQLRAEATAQVNWNPVAHETQQAAVDRNVEAGANAYAQQQRSRRLQQRARDQLMRTRGLTRAQANAGLGISETAGDNSWISDIDSLNEIVRTEQGAGRSLSELSYLVPDGRGGMRRRTEDDLDSEIAYLRQPIVGSAQGDVRRQPGESRAAFRRRLVAALRSDEQGETAAFRSKVTDIASYRRGVQIAEDEARGTKAQDDLTAERQLQIGLAEGTAAKDEEGKYNRGLLASRESFGAQFRDQFLPAAEQTKTAAEMMAEGVRGAFDTMTNAVSTHVTAIIEGRESIGEALRGIAHDTLLSLAQMATKEALMETARGTAKLAASYGADPTAYGHFAAAGIYAAVAVGAGLGAYATGAPSASAAGAGAGRTPPAAASAGVGSGQQSGGGNTYLINVNGTVMDREGTANAVLEAVNDAVGRGGVLRRAA